MGINKKNKLIKKKTKKKKTKIDIDSNIQKIYKKTK